MTDFKGLIEESKAFRAVHGGHVKFDLVERRLTWRLASHLLRALMAGPRR